MTELFVHDCGKPAPDIGVFLDASGTFLHANPLQIYGVEVFSDALKLLGCFRRRKIGNTRIRTAVVTNWGHSVNSMLSNLVLDDCFDAVVTADDTNFVKPAREIFHFASNLLGLPYARCIHVGDSLFDDALGAQNAGLHGIWLRRRAGNFMSQSENQAAARLKHPPVKTLDEALLYLELLLKEVV